MLDEWRPLEAKNARRANTLISVLIEFNEFLWEFNFYNAQSMKTFKVVQEMPSVVKFS